MIVDCAAHADGCRQTGTLDLDTAREWVSRPGHFVWLGLRMPGQAEIDQVEDLLGIDANLTQVSLQQNEDMRRISAWVAIAAVPTMLAGIYGMNFETFPELGWSFGYSLVLSVMLAAAGLLYRAFRRSGWL